MEIILDQRNTPRAPKRAKKKPRERKEAGRDGHARSAAFDVPAGGIAGAAGCDPRFRHRAGHRDVYQELRGVEKFVHGFLRWFFFFGEKATSESVARTGASRRVERNQKPNAAAAASRSFLVLDGSEIIAKCKRFGLTRDPSNI
jgi:hypothetical protein